MSKKISIKVTKSQLNAIMEMTDELSASTGSAEEDSEREKWIRSIDRMLVANGYSRNYQ